MKKILLCGMMVILMLSISRNKSYANSFLQSTPQKGLMKSTLFSELDLLDQRDVDLIESTYGRIDKSSLIRKAISDSEYCEIYALNSNQNSRLKLNIIVEIFQGQKYVNLVVSEITDKSLRPITNAQNITEGIIRLHLLNDGYVIEKDQVSGVTTIIQGTTFSGKLAGFGTCFKTCIAGYISNMGWIEGAACIIEAEVCAAGFLLGCTGCCVHNNNIGSNCVPNN